MDILESVISVSSQDNLAVWKRAAPMIAEHIPAEDYYVIVPPDAVGLFRDETPDMFRVVDEREFVSKGAGEIAKHLSDDQKHRANWYLQQFIKIAAARKMAGPRTLLWDADTIPLQPMEFFDSLGRARYLKGTEYHRPYFDTVSRLLNLERTSNFSFISQCFPLYRAWIDQFCNEVESLHGMSWDDAILHCIDGSERASFSEYETLGAFITSRYPERAVAYQTPWLRYGKAVLGDIDSVNDRDLRKLRHVFDFVSFERWDTKRRLPLRLSIFSRLMLHDLKLVQTRGLISKSS